MTKYEWEHELKKNIHRLPADEIARVLDYYNEMFEDNIERGKSEREIIREFGNPVDVADKILSEYDGELLPTEERIPVPQPPEDKPSDSGIFDGHDNNKCDDTIADKSIKDSVEQKKNEQSEYDKLDEVDKRNVKVALFLVVNFVTGFAFVIVAAVAWIVLAAFTVAGVGMGLGGAYAFIVSFGPMFTGGFGAGLAQLGISMALVGLGVILVVGCVRLIRTYAKMTKTLYNGIFKVSKEERV
ncbi:MAG: DUF1700 domain-containing protein [Clostridiales bacterium]|nr:DUF1700 domain-containing protein [Clostridiales bacterium]